MDVGGVDKGVHNECSRNVLLWKGNGLWNGVGGDISPPGLGLSSVLSRERAPSHAPPLPLGALAPPQRLPLLVEPSSWQAERCPRVSYVYPQERRQRRSVWSAQRAEGRQAPLLLVSHTQPGFSRPKGEVCV